MDVHSPVGHGIARFIDHRYPGGPRMSAIARTRLIDDLPVDLNEESLAHALEKAGFPRKRTAVIWEGVTNYLTEEAVDATLRDLTTTTAHGSTIILTYVDRSALDNDTEWHRTVAKVGEPWTFGLHPADVAGYLAARGLELRGDLSTKDAAARYHRDEPAAEFYRIAWAEVR